MPLANQTSRLQSLDVFHSCTKDWFQQVFQQPTRVQAEAWPRIAAQKSTLLLAPTGSGKTLAAFLAAIDRLFFRDIPSEVPDTESRNIPSPCSGIRVVYLSPLKALGVDVDRNLRSPIAGLRAYAERHSVAHHVPTVAIRSGDTSQKDRQHIVKNPPDILITTPESLYLMLTSQAARVLNNVETIIIDEIHAIAGTKRGSHLFVTLERLERHRRLAREDQSSPQSTDLAPLQRIGLSATQRPLSEIATLLAGGHSTTDISATVQQRPVEIVDASEKRRFDIRIETPAEDVEKRQNEQAQAEFDDDHNFDLPMQETASGPSIPSVWPSIHPRLVELIRSHRSTMIFVNSRRLAERLATAINELAEEELALAHHGSIARDTRAEIEDRLKRGNLPAMVATSSMELGIDMGTVDLVIQIEAPPSIASGTQRIGRAGHQVGAQSTGVIFPKYRGDLVACSAAVAAMLEGWVEETHYPRNPLDVLAQQIVAMTCRNSMHVDDIYATVRSAAPFFELPHASFVSVLDLLSGRYPSDEFSELRPRINWDRVSGIVSPRKGGQRLAILNAGTIPDRGLYSVHLLGDDGAAAGRVGELDEEMVFECRPGDVFLLGASSWRVMEITRDRVFVVPAPGEPGRMPFWRGDGLGRPFEFGKAIGQLTRQLQQQDRETSQQQLQQQGLETSAIDSLLDYLSEQQQATSEVPCDNTIVMETFLDEIGDWRIVILSPFGSRIHAPWALLVAARLRHETDAEVDVMWTDDGIVFRIPETHDIPRVDLFFPDPDDIESELVRDIGGTALFAARFRENAARSLLLPRRSPAKRSPLWLQRKKSADLLAVAAKYRGFPILMETYRECLRDVFDMPGLTSLMQDVKSRAVRIHCVQTEYPSPFAAAVLFHFVGNFIYNGDAPLAERKAQTLSLDHAQLKELLGTVDLRELFDLQIVRQVAEELQRKSGFAPRHSDDIHNLLLQLGSLTTAEIQCRCQEDDCLSGEVDQWIETLLNSRRAFEFLLPLTNEKRIAAAEDASRLRDAIGIVPPPGLPTAFLEPVADALCDLVSQFARTHGPFTRNEAAARLGLAVASVQSALTRLVDSGRIVEGEFLPGRMGTEFCDVNVLKLIKRRTLAALRKEVEPVETEALVRFLPDWHQITHRKQGLDGILDVIEQLQGAPLPASDLENQILPDRVRGFRTADLDELCVQGELIWRGFDSTGSSDGRIGLFLTDHYATLAPVTEPIEDSIAEEIRTLLGRRGGLFFDQMKAEVRQFPPDLLNVLWQLVWNGEITNDTLTPLRAMRTHQKQKGRNRMPRQRTFRSRRQSRLPGSEGRWSLLPHLRESTTTVTERQTAIAFQLIERHGVLTKEMLSREEVAGGFSGLYPVLKAMEEAGRVRRGYFVAGLGAAQFAAPGAEDRLRDFRDGLKNNQHQNAASNEHSKPLILAATDPANPFGNSISWPETHEANRPQRVAGAKVILWNGQLLGYLGRTRQALLTFSATSKNSPTINDLPTQTRLETNHASSDTHKNDRLLAEALATLASPGRPLLISRINGSQPTNGSLLAALLQAGFVNTSKGLLHKATPH